MAAFANAQALVQSVAMPSPSTLPVRAVPGTVSPWTFARSRPWPRAYAGRLRAIVRSLRPAPDRRELKPVTPRPRWSVYFLWAPDGQLTPAHRFTLARLRERDAGLLVVVAAPTLSLVPEALHDMVDALWWKALPGYDFSGYAIGLHAIAQASPGADVFVMNDSVMGPFGDFEPLLAEAPWNLSGFTAASLFENHIQSYAFQLRAVTPAMMRSLGTIFPLRWRLDRFQDVVFGQETRFARVASRSMTVGAWWWYDTGYGLDLVLKEPFALIEAGYPFVKRSFFGKYSGVQDAEQIHATLAALGHPPVE
jgi:lipopolysaccharide biosynthesis protein